MKVIAIIPARAGSKGIPHKNRHPFLGKPLICHTFDKAIASNVFSDIILSTDDQAIIELAKSYPQISVPFKRPATLARDNSLIADVLFHLFEQLKENRYPLPDAFMLLEPTCPLRGTADIESAIKLYKSSDKPCLVSVSSPLQHPSNMIHYHKEQKEWLYCLARPTSTTGRQDFTRTLFINGAIYLTRLNFFLQTKRLYALEQNQTAFLEIPIERGIDINTFLDLQIATLLSQTVSLKSPAPKTKPRRSKMSGEKLVYA